MITILAVDGVRHTIRKDAVDRIESSVSGTGELTRIWLRGSLFSIDCKVPHDELVRLLKTG